MPRNSGAILWISESVFLYVVSLDSKMAVIKHHFSTNKNNCYRFASPADPFRMVSGSMELHWVSISLALPLSLLRRPRVEPPGISEDLAKR